MKRRTPGILLAASLGVATGVAMVVVLAVALTPDLDSGHGCETGFSTSTRCTSQVTTTSIGPSHKVIDATSWAIAHCPCASAAAPAPAASDDPVTALPLLKPWMLRTAEDSRFIKSVHVETPLDLAAVLGFYRDALSERGWTENDGAVVEPDRAVIAFTTPDGPALLRLIHEDDTTTADLSLRKRAAEEADILPRPGQARLMLGNATDDEAVITINEQTTKLAAEAKLRNSPEIDLPPGKLKVSLQVAGSAARNRELEVGAGETWGLLAGPDGVPLPVRLY